MRCTFWSASHSVLTCPLCWQLQAAFGTLPAEGEAAVQRLAALGFARAAAVEAYLACEQDEMLAANLLMDQQLV